MLVGCDELKRRQDVHRKKKQALSNFGHKRAERHHTSSREVAHGPGRQVRADSPEGMLSVAELEELLAKWENAHIDHVAVAPVKEGTLERHASFIHKDQQTQPTCWTEGEWAAAKADFPVVQETTIAILKKELEAARADDDEEEEEEQGEGGGGGGGRSGRPCCPSGLHIGLTFEVKWACMGRNDDGEDVFLYPTDVWQVLGMNDEKSWVFSQRTTPDDGAIANVAYEDIACASKMTRLGGTVAMSKMTRLEPLPELPHMHPQLQTAFGALESDNYTGELANRQHIIAEQRVDVTTTLQQVDDAIHALLEERGLWVTKSVLADIMIGVDTGSDGLLDFEDIEKWASDQRPLRFWHRWRHLVLLAAFDMGFWGNLTFFAGFVIFAGDSSRGCVYLCRRTVEQYRVGCVCMLIGAICFVKLIVENIESAFEVDEFNVHILKTAVQHHANHEGVDLLENIDADGNGMLELSEMKTFFESYSILLTDAEILHLEEDAIIAGVRANGEGALMINDFFSYLQERKPRHLGGWGAHDGVQYVTRKVCRNISFWSMMAWVIGLSTQFAGSFEPYGEPGSYTEPSPTVQTLDTLCTILYVFGYIGYIMLAVFPVEGEFRLIATSKAALRSWASTGHGGLALEDGFSSVADIDGDGCIGVSELLGLLADSGAPPMPLAGIKYIMNEADRAGNGNGQIDYAEFDQYIKSLKGATAAEARVFVLWGVMTSVSTWALVVGFIAQLQYLGSKHIYERVPEMSEMFSMLGLFCGVVPCYVYFQCKSHNFHTFESAKLNVAWAIARSGGMERQKGDAGKRQEAESWII